MNMTISNRAREISTFLGKPYEECLAKLRIGFGSLHNEVTADWKRANPQTDDEILEWYRTTEAYIWELSAYHLDAGFNYSGMIGGIAEALHGKGVKRVLCLGDGIGDLTLQLAVSDVRPTYHDLSGSQTAKFAMARLNHYLGTSWGVYGMNMTDGWEPFQHSVNDTYDAIVSLDFLEHVTDVEAWVRAIYAALKPGGWLVAQNAFACGSGPDGAIPQHLARNDRFEKDWDPLLFGLGFTQLTSNWYQRKPQ